MLLLPLLAASIVCSSPQEDPSREVAPRHVRVVWWNEPHTRATISWSTVAESAQNRARLVSASGGEARSVPTSRDGLFSGSEEEGGMHYHHARIGELEPATLYRFHVESDGARSREYHFRTAPADDSAYTLLYGGDSRTMHEDRLRMNRMIAETASERADVLAFVHGGDYVTDGSRFEQWRTWLDHHEAATAVDGRLLPLIPARGNHDGGPLYDEIFDDPGGAGENYGSTAIGSELVLLTLNTNISTAGDQAEWLEAALPDARREHRWLLVQYHRPMWPALKSPSPAKDLWVPLFEKNDVDLVMESDGHVVKRTVPIRDGRHDPSGVTYIGEGGLGAPLRRPRDDLWYLEPPGYVGSELHISLLEVSPEALDVLTLAPPAEAEEYEPVGARTLVGADGAWRAAIDTEVAADWMQPGEASAPWPELAPRAWRSEKRALLEAGVVRARLRLDAAELAGVNELGLSVPRGVPLRVFVDGQEVASREGWRVRRWWKSRMKRFAEQPSEYLSLGAPRDSSEGLWLALEMELAPAGADSEDDRKRGPQILLLADPENLAELTRPEARVLDTWRLEPRVRVDEPAGAR